MGAVAEAAQIAAGGKILPLDDLEAGVYETLQKDHPAERTLSLVLLWCSCWMQT